MTKTRKCEECGKWRKHYAKGKCRKCYNRPYGNGPKRVEPCVACGRVLPIHGYFRCNRCYARYRRANDPAFREREAEASRRYQAKRYATDEAFRQAKADYKRDYRRI